MVGPGGVEPPLYPPQGYVLPLYDGPKIYRHTKFSARQIPPNLPLQKGGTEGLSFSVLCPGSQASGADHDLSTINLFAHQISILAAKARFVGMAASVGFVSFFTAQDALSHIMFIGYILPY